MLVSQGCQRGSLTGPCNWNHLAIRIARIGKYGRWCRVLGYPRIVRSLLDEILSSIYYDVAVINRDQKLFFYGRLDLRGGG